MSSGACGFQKRDLLDRPRADRPTPLRHRAQLIHGTQAESTISAGSASTVPTARPQNTGQTSFSTTPSEATAR